MTEIQAGLIASPGIVLGRARLLLKEARVPADGSILPQEAENELTQYDLAVETAVGDLEQLAEKSAVFAAYVDLLTDFALRESVEQNIREKLQNVQLAVYNAVEEFRALFLSTSDSYMRERSDDLLDIRERLLCALQGDGEIREPLYQEPHILLAESLTPSDTAGMNFDSALGFITEKGGVTSHIAIIARERSIPALVGVTGIMQNVSDGDFLILDAAGGRILLNPTPELIAEYRQRQIRMHREQAALQAERAPAVTRDGRRVLICANAGSISAVTRAIFQGADGVGLFRTEFLYMDGDGIPGEEEQFSTYRESAMQAGKEITIRTLDVGGDKKLSCLNIGREENPFLGWRGIRVSLELREIFSTQLRAILRASAFGKIRVMYPMVTSLEELMEANKLFEQCKSALDQKNIPFDRDIKSGVMIETPAAVILADELAKHTDFFSIGTNDLTQYVLAADRGNLKTAQMCDPFHPAVLRCMQSAIRAAHACNIKVSVCGEIAADPRATRILVGLDIDELSVVPGSVGIIKRAVRELHYGRSKKFAQKLCLLSSSSDVSAAMADTKTQMLPK